MHVYASLAISFLLLARLSQVAISANSAKLFINVSSCPRICTYIFDRTLSTVFWHIRLRSTSCGDFIVPRSNRQLSNGSFSVAAQSAWNRLPSHIRTSSTYTLFLTRLETHLLAESLLWHCDAVVFSLYFWRPRALDVERHSKFMLIDWLIML